MAHSQKSTGGVTIFAKKRRRREEGIALILALLVLVILVVLVAQMSASSLHNRTLAENHVGDLQNTYGARAGYHQGLLFLQADVEKAPEVDSMRERWASPIEFDLGRARVKVTVVDCERFINLSQLVNDKGEANPVIAAQLKRLIRVLRHPPESADRIIDYIDKDSRGEFEARARNERLFNLEELLRVEGLAPEVVYGGKVAGEDRKGLKEFVTLWPKAAAAQDGGGQVGLVNLNTASSEVLQSLADEMTLGMAEAIVAWRTMPGGDGRAQEFKKADDLKRVAGITDALFTAISTHVTVKAATFEIRARSTVGNVEKTWVYVVKRGAVQSAGAQQPAAGDKSKQPTHTLIGAQALNDFLTVTPPEEEKQ